MDFVFDIVNHGSQIGRVHAEVWLRVSVANRYVLHMYIHRGEIATTVDVMELENDEVARRCMMHGDLQYTHPMVG